MIFPVKIFNKHGELTKTITTEQLQLERDNADKKPTYRERFNNMVKFKKQKTGKVAARKRNAAPEVKRPRNPVRSGRNRGVDDGKCKKILDDKTSFIKSIEDTLKKYLK